MLTPEQIEELAARIVSGHEHTMVADLLDQLVTALVSDGKLSVRDMRLLETAAAMNREGVTQILLKHRGAISKQTRELVKQALIDSHEDDVAVITMATGYAETPGATMLFRRLAQATAQGLAEIIARDNLKMTEHAQSIWYDVAGEAIARYNHGGATLDQVMSRAVKRLSDEALSVIDYKSGVRNHIDVAVRRHVITQAGQAGGRMTMTTIQTAGCDLVRTSQHFGARPTHAVWAGQVFSLTGSDGYRDFYQATGYGTVQGLLGANCRHSYGPYYPGITPDLPEPEQSRNGMTNDEYYEATQMQRRHERGIRQTKREIAALRSAGLDDTDARLKLGNQQRKLKAYCTSKDLVRQPKREKAYGVIDQPRALRVDPRRAVTKPRPFRASDPEEWRKSLSNQQREAIADYTHRTDAEINANLRAGIPDERADLIGAAITGFNHEAMTLHRGMGRVHLPGEWPPEVGTVIPDKAFMSCSNDPEQALAFALHANELGNKGIMLRIDLPRGHLGAPISSISAKPDEAEFLLAPDREMQVVGYDDYHGVPVLRVRIIK